MNIDKIDVNFTVDSEIDKSEFDFYSPERAPFRLYGVFRDGDCLRRMPEAVAESVSEGVHVLSRHTAGGRVRFVTDSAKIAISVRLVNDGHMPHMPMTGSSGFDLYSDGAYMSTARPPVNMKSCAYEQVLTKNNGESVVTLNLPLYNGIHELYIGVEKGSVIKEAPDYKYEKPIVFYGSSITQGGCASRPGTCYEAILSRVFDSNYINLGFSGNAKGEITMAEYIAGLDMSAFVYDYDHNATSVEYLAQTHERMFKIIREKHPMLPIIIVSAPKYPINEFRKRTREVIMSTYNNARGVGDENVYFVDGSGFFDEIGDGFSVDGTHPNDLGFYFMAKGIKPALDTVIGKM